jgi:hypothetical protein
VPGGGGGSGGAFMGAEHRGSNNNYARQDGQASAHLNGLLSLLTLTRSESFPLLSNSQNLGNFMTDRNSSRVLAPPGGVSSISFGS